MHQRFLPIVFLLAVAGCYSPTRSGGLTPYPPGPVDTLNILLRNDYSRLCPERYEYCAAGKRSVCCPKGGCCDDGTGPYCCDHGGYAADDRDHGRDYDDRRYDDDRDRPPSGYGPCGPRSTTCARGSVTICCGESEGCCADDQGLYCCAASRGRY